MQWFIIIGAIVIIILGLWTWRSFFGTEDIPTTVVSGPGAPQVDLRVTEVTRDANIFLDKTLSLRGVLTDWATDRSFVISDAGGLFPSGSGLLVISPYAFDVPLETPTDQLALGENPQLYVRGPIRLFNAEDYANEYNLNDEDRDELNTYDGNLVMVAEVVEKE